MTTSVLTPQLDLNQLERLMAPSGFAVHASDGEWKRAQHLDHLEDVLFRLVEGELEGAVISMPPRHGKSEFCSKYFPAWFLGRYPEKRVMLGAYEADFASTWGRKVRDLLVERGGWFGIEVDTGSRARNRWDILGFGGGMDTAGVGGAFTGKGGHCLIVDDPIKNADQAKSEVFREKAWDWWMSTFETRREPGGFFLVIQTRWHQDDLAGRLIKEIEAGSRPNWEVLEFRALAEAEDPLGRDPGEALWPMRYTTEQLTALKNRLDHDEARMGPYWWDALYQQRPVPLGGDFFKDEWFRYYNEGVRAGKRVWIDAQDPNRFWNYNDLEIVTTVDLAVSEKEDADYTVLITWAVDRTDFTAMIIDVHRERLNGAQHMQALRDCYEMWQPTQILIEAVQFQAAVVHQAVAEGIPAKKSFPRGDKVARATSFATLLEAGKILFPRKAAWLEEFEEELLIFPKGEHDDQVDPCSLFANEVAYQSAEVGVIC